MSVILVAIILECSGLKLHVQMRNVDTPLRAFQTPLWQFWKSFGLLQMIYDKKTWMGKMLWVKGAQQHWALGQLSNDTKCGFGKLILTTLL